jgi:hypothetical protein
MFLWIGVLMNYAFLKWMNYAFLNWMCSVHLYGILALRRGIQTLTWCAVAYTESLVLLTREVSEALGHMHQETERAYSALYT